MKHDFFIILLIFFVCFLFGLLLSAGFSKKMPDLSYERFCSQERVSRLFCTSEAEIEKTAAKAIKVGLRDLKKIVNIPQDERTYENTVRAIDAAKNRFRIKMAAIESLSLVSPDEKIRVASQQKSVELNNFLIDNFIYNKDLYKAVSFIDSKKDALTSQESYFLKELLKDFQRLGMKKDASIREKIRQASKDVSELSLKFNQNIALDNRSIKVKLEDLAGLDSEFINSLKKIDNETYEIAVNAPTATKILQECNIGTTRKKLWTEFVSKGHPKNQQILEQIIAKRDELAKLLDFDSYADFDIEDQMAGNISTVEDFLNKLIPMAKEKANKEFEVITKDLPDGVELVNGKLEPWDLSYVINHYKKKHLALDEKLISDYFPLDYTFSKLFEIYEKFFGLSFKKFDAQDFWHPSVQGYFVYKGNVFLGTLLLDLFPRENKFGHAAQIAIVPGIKTKDSDICPAVALVMANFPLPVGNKPALLKRSDVVTFFHECGHAIHSLLGGTEMASLSGTSTKGDFVEMPSQMLEYWMWNPEILKMVSSHYETNKPLDDDLIAKIKSIEHFDKGIETLLQIYYSLISLEYFKEGNNKDVYGLWKKHYEDLLNHLVFEKDNVRYCSFEHLSDYASKYYGYLWSKVYAADLFDTIKQHGLLDDKIGQKYIDTVISKGGSSDPYQLVKDFLGRDPNPEAFFKDLGLN